MKIHHIGYAVKDINLSLSTFLKIGYLQKSKIITDTQRNVKILFIENNSVLIELVEPLNDKSPVKQILDKNQNIPYHICYCVKEIYMKKFQN